MAQETRIGLLVGLAFIICFAVVLANRGKQDPLSNPMPYGMFVSRETGKAAPTQAPAPGTAIVPSQPATIVPAPDAYRDSSPHVTPATRVHIPGAVQKVTPAEVSPARLVQRGDSSTSRLAMADAQDPTGSRDSSIGRESWQGQDESDPVSVLPSDRPRLELTPTELERARRLEQMLIEKSARQQESGPVGSGERAGGLRPGDGSAVQDAQQPPQHTTLIATQRGRPLPKVTDDKIVRYVVRSGDTLSKIALEAYGTKSPTVVEAIFKANQRVLGSPDELKVGDELILPPVPGFGDPSLSQDRGPRPSAEPDASEQSGKEDPPEERFRWYQVKEKDRYASIAREQLGDERRWREIYELNKDKFPDANVIRPGVRIKLPVVDAADSTGGGR
ncbi:MAG: LysM peptidoglycan-binding domain-containing protein [Phycisphaerales bacterium]|nr:MAG: LysM peptidoglycan-binding domain-containing protein [Phycisphaerales bacterium]